MTFQLSLTAFNTVRGYNTVHKNISIVFTFHINIVFQDILKKSVFDVKGNCNIYLLIALVFA